MKRIAITDLQRMRDEGTRFAMLTAYDYPTAQLADEAGIPILLVGDSLGMVVLGYDSTLPVTVDDMVRHGAAVVRGTKRAHVVVDMPFGSYQGGWQDALRNAVRIMQETGAGSVKLEGGQRSAETVQRLVEAGIPVMGHVGLTPQSVNAYGGWKIQGKTPREGVRVMADAKALEEAGAYAVVLETVPAPLAFTITQQLHVPTIGIGAGLYCSGQVQVVHDLLGLYTDRKMKHARRFMEAGTLQRAAFVAYREAVGDGSFPSAAESHLLDEQRVARVASMTFRPADSPHGPEGIDLEGVLAEGDPETGER